MRIILIIPDVHLKLYFPIHKEAIDVKTTSAGHEL